MEKKTIEEAAKEYLNSGKIPNDYQAFIAGTEYQSEQMYSEEDMIQFAKWLFQNSTYHTLFNNSQLLKEWKESKS